jgi:hypothetical protein
VAVPSIGLMAKVKALMITTMKRIRTNTPHNNNSKHRTTTKVDITREVGIIKSNILRMNMKMITTTSSNTTERNNILTESHT